MIWAVTLAMNGDVGKIIVDKAKRHDRLVQREEQLHLPMLSWFELLPKVKALLLYFYKVAFVVDLPKGDESFDILALFLYREIRSWRLLVNSWFVIERSRAVPFGAHALL